MRGGGEARRGRLCAQGDLDGEDRRRRRAAAARPTPASSFAGRAAIRRTRALEWIYRYARQARLVDGASEVHRGVQGETTSIDERDRFWMWDA
jgi:hypothetical protein